jgi:hypothetical protein
MKKLFILSILFSLFCFSCTDDPEPEPDLIRAYCFLYHFIPELGSVIWDVDEVEVPDESDFAEQFAGSIILDTETEMIAFSVKQPGTNEVLASETFQLEKDKYYTLIASGSADNVTFFIREIDTGRPQGGNVKFQLLHSAPDQNSIDLYMGGTASEKKLVSDLPYLDLTAPFEAKESDARASITVSKHGDEYQQDSVILSSIYNDGIISGASYLSVLANFTHEPASDLTLWLYLLPTE